MIDDEQKMRELEEQIPLLANEAFSRAYEETLKAGLSVLVAKGEYIYEVFPDGTRKVVKKINPPIPATPGQIYRFR